MMTTTEPHVVSDKVFTSQSAFADIRSIIASAHRFLDRKAYMDLLCNVNNDSQARLDTCNEEIGREMHERRDDV